MSMLSEWMTGEMERRGLSLREVGGNAGVSPATVVFWMRGAVKPSWEACGKIAAAMGADPRDIRAMAGYTESMTDADASAAVDEARRHLGGDAP